MNTKKSLQNLLTKPMDRKEFLQYAGATALALVGVSGLVKTLLGSQHVKNGYGSSSYGGKSVASATPTRKLS